MTRIVYIGNDDMFIENISSSLDKSVYIAHNIVCAEEYLRTVRNDDKIIFYEKRIFKTDIEYISYLKNSFENLYLILISEDLEKDMLHKYLSSGINNSISPLISKDKLKDLIDFILIHKDLMTNHDVNIEIESVDVYKISFFKRLFDVVSSSFLLVLCSPLLAIVAVAIRIESKGPVIYKSKRIGHNCHIFNCFKFRSMRNDADKKLKEYASLNLYKSEKEKELNVYQSDLVYISDDKVITEEERLEQLENKGNNIFLKLENDPRVTKVGRLIRKYSIDELPQMINILLGDMSIVGNRPLPLYEGDLLTVDESIERFVAPAGLTGLWQVSRDNKDNFMSEEERISLDIYYARNSTAWMDMKILLKTFRAVVQKNI